MRPLALLFLGAITAVAQPLSAGLKIGVPLTDFINTVSSQSFTTTNRYILGPTVELHLPAGFGVEFDILYRHYRYSEILGAVGSALTSSTTTGAWEFPLLLKYRFPTRVVRPYVDAGVSWDKLSGLTSTFSGSGLQNNTTMGAVLGGGLDIHLLIVHILPEVRYTRWTSQHFNIGNIINSNQNQAEFLLGITF